MHWIEKVRALEVTGPAFQSRQDSPLSNWLSLLGYSPLRAMVSLCVKWE